MEQNVLYFVRDQRAKKKNKNTLVEDQKKTPTASEIVISQWEFMQGLVK